MSRRQQHASLVRELHERVQLTPLKEGNGSGECSPARAEDSGEREKPNGASDLFASSEPAASLESTAKPHTDTAPNNTVSTDEQVEAPRILEPSSPPHQLDASPQGSSSARVIPTIRRVIIASPVQRDGAQRVVVTSASPLGSGRSQTADDEQRARKELENENARLKDAVHCGKQRIADLEALVRELSATVHQHAVALEQERRTIRGLQETLLSERASASAAARRPVSPNRSSVTTAASRVTSSRTSSPSIARPTVSSSRRSPSAPNGQRYASPVGTSQRAPPGRTLSPMATRQQLATATFMQGTSASNSRGVSNANSSNQPGARPRLGPAVASSSGRALDRQPAPQTRTTTTVVMHNGVIVPPATSSATRRITPARERVDAAIARMLPQRSQGPAHPSLR